MWSFYCDHNQKSRLGYNSFYSRSGKRFGIGHNRGRPHLALSPGQPEPMSEQRLQASRAQGFEFNTDVTPSTFRPGRLRGVRTAHTISSVTRVLATALLLLSIVSSTNLAFCEPSAKVEKITGRIVAYSSDLTCLNGNGYWSMLIRIQARTTGRPPRFVQVGFSLPCAEHPEWLDRKPSVQKFRLKRQQDADSILKEFYDCAPDSDDKCPRVRMWKPLPGTEDEKLPFGQRVPSYRSINPPLFPVV